MWLIPILAFKLLSMTKNLCLGNIDQKLLPSMIPPLDHWRSPAKSRTEHSSMTFCPSITLLFIGRCSNSWTQSPAKMITNIVLLINEQKSIITKSTQIMKIWQILQSSFPNNLSIKWSLKDVPTNVTIQLSMQLLEFLEVRKLSNISTVLGDKLLLSHKFGLCKW